MFSEFKLRKLSKFILFPQFLSYTFAPAVKKAQHNILVEKAGDLFKRYGVKSLTMDDVARELGMSKKTIYQFVENKSQLVQLSMENYLNRERTELEEILKESKNSVDEMIGMITYFINQVQDFNPSIVNDLEKYYPETWNIFNEYRFNFMLKCIGDNLKNGIRQGYYRNNLNADIISKIYIGCVDVLFNQDFFPSKKYVFADIYKEYLNYHLRGIVTPKGMKYLEQNNLFKG